jgi:hypothetical protein
MRLHKIIIDTERRVYACSIKSENWKFQPAISHFKQALKFTTLQFYVY